VAEWLCLLRPPRQTFVDDMTEDEAAIMRDHFRYLETLLADGALVLAGPSLGPVFGVCVFEAEDEEAAQALAAADPSVTAGLQTAELSPFRVSLLRGRD